MTYSFAIQSLGVADAARELAAAQAPTPPVPRLAPRPRVPKASLLHTERRRSSRVQNGKICYQVCAQFPSQGRGDRWCPVRCPSLSNSPPFKLLRVKQPVKVVAPKKCTYRQVELNCMS